MAVAVLPLAAGLSARAYTDPLALTSAFHTAMAITACVAGAGGVLAWLTIRSDVLHRRAGRPEHHYSHCALDGPPLLESDARAPGLLPAASAPE
jgi:hypothetical protein